MNDQTTHVASLFTCTHKRTWLIGMVVFIGIARALHFALTLIFKHLLGIGDIVVKLDYNVNWCGNSCM